MKAQRARLSESELRQKRYYNQIAATYDHHYGNQSAIRYRAEVFDRFLAELDVDWEQARVLDAMCGGGENAAYFANRGAHIAGIDISDAQCAFFRQRFPDAEIVCHSIFDAPFKDASFDFVVTESLHHLHPNLELGLREIARIVKPGGYFMAWEPVSGSALDALRKLWYRLDRRYFQDNEASVDLDAVSKALAPELDLVKVRYGGNVAHLFVMSSMHLRIPVSWVHRYAPPLLWAERWIERAQTRLTSCWALALYHKRRVLMGMGAFLGGRLSDAVCGHGVMSFLAGALDQCPMVV
jgi:SAM-dependent methyltransferase